MPWIPLHQTWHIYWQIYSPSQLSIDPLNTITPNWADLLADLPPPPVNWAEMPCILLHQTWQIYWQIYPPQSSIVALNTATPNLADLTPSQLSIDALNTITPNVADLPLSQLSIDALNTAIPNLTDLPQRTSTYERPFTCEGNYLVNILLFFCSN